MSIRMLLLGFTALLVLAMPLTVFPSDAEDARSAGCLPKESTQPASSVCASCHNDAQKRWDKSQHRPCTQYCMTCHKATEMGRHHTVGTALPKSPDDDLPLAAEMKMACFTCHNMSRDRYDSVRWKASSLFDKMFRAEKRYKTYFLSQRNDQGQLCLSCH